MELQNILKLYLGDRVIIVISFRNTQNVLNFVII